MSSNSISQPRVQASVAQLVGQSPVAARIAAGLLATASVLYVTLTVLVALLGTIVGGAVQVSIVSLGVLVVAVALGVAGGVAVVGRWHRAGAERDTFMCRALTSTLCGLVFVGPIMILAVMSLRMMLVALPMNLIFTAFLSGFGVVCGYGLLRGLRSVWLVSLGFTTFVALFYLIVMRYALWASGLGSAAPDDVGRWLTVLPGAVTLGALLVAFMLLLMPSMLRMFPDRKLERGSLNARLEMNAFRAAWLAPLGWAVLAVAIVLALAASASNGGTSGAGSRMVETLGVVGAIVAGFGVIGAFVLPNGLGSMVAFFLSDHLNPGLLDESTALGLVSAATLVGVCESALTLGLGIFLMSVV